MLDPNLLEQLSDPNPEKRKQAIQALVDLNDYDAMEYLKNVYYTDDDPEVREAARVAGIQLRSEHEQESPNEPTGFEGVPRPAQSGRRGGAGTVSPLPSIAKHSVTEERNRNHTELTWQDVVPQVMLLALVMIVGVYITFTSLTPLFDELIVEIREDIELGINADFTESDIDAFQEMIDNFESGGIMIALIGGLGSIVAFIIECYIINHLAISSYKGRGGIYEFIRDFALANALAWAVFYVFIVIIMQQIEVSALIGSDNISSSSGALSSTILPCGFLFAVIGIIYYLSRVISKSYQIRGWHGFIALMIGFIASQIALSMLQFCATPIIG